MVTRFPRPALAAPKPAAASRSGKTPPSPTSDIPVSATTLDRALHAAVAKFTGGLSPMGLALAGFDWAGHLLASPGRQAQLGAVALAEAMRVMHDTLDARRDPIAADPSRRGLPHDKRFTDEAWRHFPFDFYARSFIAAERWWDEAAKVPGTSARHQALVSFVSRQLLDMVAPSNFPATNPQVLKRIAATGGANLVEGAANLVEDVSRLAAGRSLSGPEDFAVGETVAVTPGEVVARTRLAEIIQYAPATGEVHAEPLVIVPAWIMKYYILDLSPQNSLVRFLTEQGFTVFLVSWKNPGPEDRETSFDAYRTEGVMAAIEAASAITGSPHVHGVGYCLGGTLFSIAAAAMARDGDTRLKTLSLFASQVDFHEAGELRLFINESELALLDDMMWERGYLDSSQMAGAFHILRSNDLVWSRLVHEYMMGERSPKLDIMAWSQDSTRLPHRMHSEYLRSLYLENRLAEGRFEVEGRPVAIPDITAPMFVVGTEGDHIAPWRSVFKIQLDTEAEVTFVLTNGGHNAGIVSEPGHHGRRYRLSTRPQGGHYVDPDTWLTTATPHEGSWWTAWVRWLQFYAPAKGAPPPMGRPDKGYRALEPAPGSYVHG
jgi:polyhydroxyalkanoate synthase subunit PhaC